MGGAHPDFSRPEGSRSRGLSVWAFLVATVRHHLVHVRSSCVLEWRWSFFDENSVAVFDSDPATIGMVEIWRQMYEEELVPPDILAIDYGATGGLFGVVLRLLRFGINLRRSLGQIPKLVPSRASSPTP